MATAERHESGDSLSIASGSVVLITSPHAGQAAHSSNPKDLLQAAEINVAEVLDVRDLDLYHPQGKRWLAQGYTAAIAAGGDGTIGNIATQLAGSRLPLGILPMGTSNDVARSLGVPLNITAAAQALTKSIATAVDVGEVVLLEGEKPQKPPQQGLKQSINRGLDRLLRSRAPKQQPAQITVNFVHAATIGLNAEFARLATDVARRRRWGNLTYATAALEALLHIQPLPLKITFRGVPSSLTPTAHAGQNTDNNGTATPEHTIEAQVVQLAVVNTPIFGGRMNLQLPLSHPSDQLLDFVIIEALEPPALRESIGYLLSKLEQMGDSLLHRSEEEAEERAYKQGLITNQIIPGVHHIQAHTARIETTDPVDVTLDGELGLLTPVEIRIAQQPLQVLLPQAAHDSLLHGELPIRPPFPV